MAKRVQQWRSFATRAFSVPLHKRKCTLSTQRASGPFVCSQLAAHFATRADITLATLLFDERVLRLRAAHLSEQKLRLTNERHRLLTTLVTQRAMHKTAGSKQTKLQNRLSIVDRAVQKLHTQSAEIQQLLQDQPKAHRPDTGFANLRGALPLPAQGVITNETPFAKAVTIRAYQNTVRAVAAGIVIYTGALKTLGLTVVLDHGQEYYSIYGQLDALRINEGQEVQANSAIATLAPQSFLYFALRRGQTALNPRLWTQRQ